MFVVQRFDGGFFEVEGRPQTKGKKLLLHHQKARRRLIRFGLNGLLYYSITAIFYNNLHASQLNSPAALFVRCTRSLHKENHLLLAALLVQWVS